MGFFYESFYFRRLHAVRRRQPAGRRRLNLTTALMTIMVNARHLFYGVSMLERYKDTKPYKPYLIFGLTDETYSLVCSGDVPAGVDRNKYFFLLTMFNQCYWIIGGVAGNLIGSLITFNTAGIEFSMTSLFLVVFTEQWMSTKDHTSAIIGVVTSAACLLIFGSDNFLIPAMIGITIILIVLGEWRKRKGRKK